MLDSMPPNVALLCLGSMFLFGVGMLIVFHVLAKDKQKNEGE